MLNKLKVMIFGGKPDEERRRTPKAGKPPAVDGHIVKQKIVIKITAPMSSDLWEWFTLMGWREIDISTNRRKVSRLPSGTFEKIAQADFSEREAIYRRILQTIKTA